VEDKGGHHSVCGHIPVQKEKYYIILYNTHQEMAIWKSIVTLIYRELLALGRKIDIFKLIYRYLLAFGR
jgi:hypothetical protein